MQLTTVVLTAVLCLSTAVSAAFNTSQEFHLITRLLKPRYKRYRFDDTYIYSYHTGAGFSDACAGPLLTNGNGIAFLNTSGHVIFDLGDNVPNGLTLEYVNTYTQWGDVTIDGGLGTAGFFFNGSGLVSNTYPWTGWIVCDWSHGVPQLFYRQENSTNLPRSCGNVELHPVYI